MHTGHQDPSLEEVELERACRDSQPAGEPLIGRLRSLLTGALAVCLLLWVAIYNGYPTVFSDTGSYLLTGALFVSFAPFRAPVYGIFTRLTSLGSSPWFTIVAQAVIVVYVLRETCAYLIGGSRKFVDSCLLAFVCILAALTSLPWLVSQLMPDVFAGVVFLSAFLLAFAGELRLIPRIILAAILAISIGAHTSLLPIALIFVAGVFALRFFALRPQAFPPTRSALVWLLVPILAAGFVTATLNRKMGVGFKVAPSSTTFLLARLFGDGLAADYLRENCPKRALISCRYLLDLPQTQDDFMFYHPLLRALAGHQDEMEAIVRGTLLAYPIKFVSSSVKDILVQLAAIRTGGEFRSNRGRYHDDAAIPQIFPRDFQVFSNSRQYRGSMLPLVHIVATVDTAIFWLSVAACLLLARTHRFPRINQFFYSAIIFLIINAAICATFAGVYDRYQSRMAWIIPFGLTAYICCIASDWKRGGVYT